MPSTEVKGASSSAIAFECNICDARCSPGDSQLGRDVSSCPNCDSTPRVRSVVYVLSEALFGRNLRLSEFPNRPDLKGIGLSDWGYDRRLAAKLSYTNTFYDAEPRLDITDPPPELYGTLDFLIASDVFEHVSPPVERALENVHRLLRPGGVFVLTVPYLTEGETREHYPRLHEWEIVDFKGAAVLVNRTTDGRWEVFENPKFHGGHGCTLEMRIFSHSAVIRQLQAAGFDEITDWRDRYLGRDPCWVESHSFPFVARRSAR
jgi:SAM-dependent methyltransferase